MPTGGNTAFAGSSSVGTALRLPQEESAAPRLVDSPTISHGSHGNLGRVGMVLHESYRVERLIAEGGMGSVYEVEHLRLQQRFALKFLEHQAARNDEAYARFRQEAEIAASLNHRAIVQVFDFNTDESGNPYMVMEYVEGATLGDYIDRKPMPLKDVMRIFEPLLGGLAAAHRAGIVHRDLKPSNIMVRRLPSGEFEVKLLDFGISKMRDAEQNMTRENVVMGTPNYMSPEQARGKTSTVDAKTDIFALGAILYEMLTGRRAFDGGSTPQLLHAIVYEQPVPMERFRKDLPPALVSIVNRCLAKSPSTRFPNVRELVQALQRSLRAHKKKNSLPTVTQVQPAQDRKAALKPVWLAFGWASTVAATAVFAFALATGNDTPAPAAVVKEPAVATTEPEAAKPQAEPEFSAVLASPGARMLTLGTALYRADGRGLTLWPHPAASAKIRALPSASPVTALAMSREGELVVGQADGAVSRWDRELKGQQWHERIGKHPITAVAAGDDYLAVASNGKVELLNMKTGRTLKRFQTGPVVELLLTRDPGRTLMVVRKYDVEVINVDRRRVAGKIELVGHAIGAAIIDEPPGEPAEITIDFHQGDWLLRRHYRLRKERRGVSPSLEAGPIERL